MWTLGDVFEGAARFVRGTGAPRVAALWALGAFLVAAVLIRRRQDDFGWKLGSSLLAFGGAAGALLWWSLQAGATYYLFVDEAVARTQAMRMCRAPVRVHGCVVTGSLEQRRGTDDFRFELKNRYGRPPAVIRARYTGSLPDAFRTGAEIIASGTLAADGGLDVIPEGIWVKCPSKYDGPAPPLFDCDLRFR